MLKNKIIVEDVTDLSKIDLLYGSPYMWCSKKSDDVPKQMTESCEQREILFKNDTVHIKVVSGKDLKKTFHKRKSARFPVNDTDVFYIMSWDDFDDKPGTLSESEKFWKNGRLMHYLDDLVDSI